MPAMCRLCAEESKDTTNIFSAKGCELRLADKIHKCLPVVVSRLHISLLVRESETDIKMAYCVPTPCM